MRAMASGWLALFLCAATVAAETVECPGSRTRFEKTYETTVDGKKVTMDVTGTAVRTKFAFNVYAMASYIQRGTPVRSPEELASASVPKQLVLVLERSVSGATMGDAVTASVTANYPTQFNSELSKIKQFMSQHKIVAGDRVWITNYPGRGVEFNIVGKGKLMINDARFGKAIWDIYLGPKNLGAHIKTGLTSML